MPHYYRDDDGPNTRAQWWTVVIILVVFVAGMIVEVCINFTPVKLSALLVGLFWVPLLALHEAGHAVAAHLLGWRVVDVVIGIGKPFHRFRAGTADVALCPFPVSGFVRCAPRRLRRPRLEDGLISFAGPGVELLLAVLLMLLIGPSNMFSATDNYFIIACQSLALAATAGALMNLIPFPITMHDRVGYSDGLNIILCFSRPTSYYAGMLHP